MSTEENNKPNPDVEIFEILGIDPTQHSAEVDIPTLETTVEPAIADDLDAPTGSIFDNYSTYKSDQTYWKKFRIMTWVGIAVFFLPLIILGISQISFSSFKSSPEPVYAEEVSEEPAEGVTEEVVEVEETIETNDETNNVETSGYVFFKGEINNKYSVCMMLDFDSEEGAYYYTRSGSGNWMQLKIANKTEGWNSVHLEIYEYNSDDEYTGYWSGEYDGQTFSGTGNFLGKEMPFDLTVCDAYETNFVN